MGFFKSVRNVKNHAGAFWNGEVRCDQCGGYVKDIDSNGIPLIGEVAALAGRIHATATKNFCCAVCEYNYMKEHPEYKKEPSMFGQIKNQIKEELAPEVDEMKEQLGGIMAEATAPISEAKDQMKEQIGGMFGQMKGSLGGMFSKKK